VSVFWLIATLAAAVLGGGALFAALGRLARDGERLLSDAPLLSGSAIIEGAFGRIEGIATSTQPLLNVPGLEQSCLIYELVVRARDGSEWSELDRVRKGVELSVQVGNVSVRVDGAVVVLVSSAMHTEHRNLGSRMLVRDGITSTVHYVPPGAHVNVAGTIAREVETDPSATTDYRELATRFRMVPTRARPVVLACRLDQK
jgi:hypothetical protein